VIVRPPDVHEAISPLVLVGFVLQVQLPTVLDWPLSVESSTECASPQPAGDWPPLADEVTG
jgi:hypothetical protein